MRSSLLNIGMDRRGGGRLWPALILGAISAFAGEEPLEYRVHMSDSEPTFVAKLRRPINATALYALSEFLDQDAIAQWDGYDGDLVGPAKDAWGAFDPAFFLTLDGSRLDATQQRRAA